MAALSIFLPCFPEAPPVQLYRTNACNLCFSRRSVNQQQTFSNQISKENVTIVAELAHPQVWDFA